MNIIFLEHKLCEDFVFKNVLFELIPRSSMKQNQNDNKITFFIKGTLFYCRSN